MTVLRRFAESDGDALYDGIDEFRPGDPEYAELRAQADALAGDQPVDQPDEAPTDREAEPESPFHQDTFASLLREADIDLDQ
ncbi:hypothetical protein EBN03_33095 [Nocardia stercoris]|uniref:Uncharacterized protein n=1 Tax=Nocardia stercoris TaxID=2483361 RepID=A0A3M2KQG7_9NOCA|nr:hypothetical protein EBN03_33095 [Nocardia stercoris]